MGPFHPGPECASASGSTRAPLSSAFVIALCWEPLSLAPAERCAWFRSKKDPQLLSLALRSTYSCGEGKVDHSRNFQEWTEELLRPPFTLVSLSEKSPLRCWQVLALTTFPCFVKNLPSGVVLPLQACVVGEVPCDSPPRTEIPIPWLLRLFSSNQDLSQQEAMIRVETGQQRRLKSLLLPD
jgi:hypothetical protein